MSDLSDFKRSVHEPLVAALTEERDRMAVALRRCLRDRREADKIYAYCVDALGPNEASNILGGMTYREQRASALNQEQRNARRP